MGVITEDDPTITILSRFSDTIRFNTVHVPMLDVSGDYHFYEEHETNVESQESKDLEHFANSPRYIRLRWNTVRDIELAPGLIGGFHGVPTTGVDDISLRDVEVVNTRIMRDPIVIIRH